MLCLHLVCNNHLITHLDGSKIVEVWQRRLIMYLGDKLPTVYDAAIALLSMATKPKSEKMHSAILKYRKSLISMWHRSFGKEHTISIPAVTRKLEFKGSRVKPKHDTEVPISKRMLNKTWRLAPISDSKKSKGEKTNNDLLDIGKDMDNITGREKVFYQDQLRERECRLSEEIDDEYEQDCQRRKTRRREKGRSGIIIPKFTRL